MKYLSAPLILSLLLFSAEIAQAQQLRSDWQRLIGCWQLVEERSRNDQVASRTCFTPGDPSDSVIVTTTLSDGTSQVRTITAGGQAYPIEAGACKGTERAEWSANGRLFTAADLTCASPDDTRRVSGMRLLVNGDTLIHIEAAGPHVEVRRFFREGDRPAGVDAGARPFTIADIRAATGKVSPLVLEAAIVESHARFALDGRTLLGLDAAGVDDRVIDLMVAVSFPDSFIVDRPGVPPGRVSGGGGGGGGGIYGSGLFEYSSAEYPFSPWDYYFWSYITPRYRDAPWRSGQAVGAVGVDAGDSGTAGGGAGGEGSGGIAVNGAGYTRVRSTGDVAVARDGVASIVSGKVPSARESNGGGADASSSGSGSGGSSSGGGVSSDGGYSSGGGGDGGRSAVPR